MNQYKVAVLVGSIRKDSYNKRLMHAVAKLAPANFQFEQVRIDDLPFYSQDFDTNYPPTALRLKQDLESAHALLFITPEYNRSISGVLKNAIDIASRPWNSNSFAGKPAAVIGTSIGTLGTALAQDHLRSVLYCLNVPVLRKPEIYLHFHDELIATDGTIANDATRELMQRFVDSYVAWVEHVLDRH